MYVFYIEVKNHGNIEFVLIPHLVLLSRKMYLIIYESVFILN